MTPEEKRAMIRAMLAGGKTDMQVGMDANLREPLYMSPEYQSVLKALTAGGADMGAQAGAPPKFVPGTGMAGVYEDQSPQDQRQIAQFMKGGLSADSAFENVIGDPYGNPSRATMPPAPAPSDLRRRQMMERAQRAAQGPQDATRSLASLLMQGGMTPGQMYTNAAGNDAPGSGPAAWARERAMAGNTVAQAPFDPLEALSAQQAMEQALMGSESRAPATSPRPQPAPPERAMMGQPDGYQSVFSDLSPEEQAGIAQALQAGLSIDDAFNAVLGIDMNAISRGQ